MTNADGRAAAEEARRAWGTRAPARGRPDGAARWRHGPARATAVTFVLLSLLLVAPRVQAATPHRVLQRAGPLPSGGVIEAVAALDADTAWVVGTGGTVCVTHDGGRTWTRSATGAPATTEWRAVWFTDESHGVLAGADGGSGLVCVTTDGGTTWKERLRLSGAPLSGLAFWGADLGWVTGRDGTICATVDGGATWALQRSPTRAPLRALSLAGWDRGLAVGDRGTLVRTHDGGAEWRRVRSHTTRRLLDIDYVTRSVGYAVGRHGVVIKTVNWGHHWDRLRTLAGGADCVAVDFATEDRGLVGLADGRLLSTTDGGRTWSVAGRAAGGLRDVAFALPAAGTPGGAGPGGLTTARGVWRGVGASRAAAWVVTRDRVYRYLVSGAPVSGG